MKDRQSQKTKVFGGLSAAGPPQGLFQSLLEVIYEMTSNDSQPEAAVKGENLKNHIDIWQHPGGQKISGQKKTAPALNRADGRRLCQGATTGYWHNNAPTVASLSFALTFNCGKNVCTYTKL